MCKFRYVWRKTKVKQTSERFPWINHEWELTHGTYRDLERERECKQSNNKAKQQIHYHFLSHLLQWHFTRSLWAIRAFGKNSKDKLDFHRFKFTVKNTDPDPNPKLNIWDQLEEKVLEMIVSIVGHSIIKSIISRLIRPCDLQVIIQTTIKTSTYSIFGKKLEKVRQQLSRQFAMPTVAQKVAPTWLDTTSGSINLCILHYVEDSVSD